VQEQLKAICLLSAHAIRPSSGSAHLRLHLWRGGFGCPRADWARQKHSLKYHALFLQHGHPGQQDLAGGMLSPVLVSHELGDVVGASAVPMSAGDANMRSPVRECPLIPPSSRELCRYTSVSTKEDPGPSKAFLFKSMRPWDPCGQLGGLPVTPPCAFEMVLVWRLLVQWEAGADALL